MARFINQVGRLGLTGMAGTISPNRDQVGINSLNRFDWNMGQSHIVTISNSITINTQDPTRLASTQLQQVGGNADARRGSRILQVASRMGRWVNQFRGSGTLSDNTSNPYLYAPAGRVTNQSTLDSGQIAVTTFGFGGNAGLPQHTTNRKLEFTNELSVLPGNATHRFVLGLYANGAHFNQDATNNRAGTYRYNSLQDFITNTPAQFTRTLQPTIRDGGAWNEAIYLSDAWRPRTARAAAPARDGGGGEGGAFGGRGGGGGA